ncbi:MAG: DUF1015 family protein [Actinomycetota bacterium]
MVAVRPFQGQIVRADRVGEVVSPAYDALTVAQRRQYRVDHPLCYLHVTRSAPDEDDADTVDNATLVRRGRAALERLLAADVLDAAGTPTLLVYELERGDHRQRGVVCEILGSEFRRAARPHEDTRPERAALLAEHFSHVRAASSPVACTIEVGARLAAALDTVGAESLVLEHEGGDGLIQRVWRVDHAATESEILASLANDDIYIIDGHHRAAANGQILDSGHDVPVLAAIFPPESLSLAGFHRLIRLPERLSEADLVKAVSRRFRVEPHQDRREPQGGSVAMYADGSWHTVHFDERPVSGSPLVRLGSLDPTIVEREIVRAIVARNEGTADVDYMPDEGDSQAVADHAATEGRVPILVPAVTVADMVEVADGGLTMPAKSTYFVPKVRSGLFIRLLDEFDHPAEA